MYFFAKPLIYHYYFGTQKTRSFSEYHCKILLYFVCKFFFITIELVIHNSCRRNADDVKT